LVSEYLRARFLGFGLVDELHQDSLVLEDITLGFLIKLMIPVTFILEPDPQRLKGIKTRIVDPDGVTHRCLSIFPASLYLRSSRLNTR
jgi:hypothetical protein